MNKTKLFERCHITNASTPQKVSLMSLAKKSICESPLSNLYTYRPNIRFSLKLFCYGHLRKVCIFVWWLRYLLLKVFTAYISASSIWKLQCMLFSLKSHLFSFTYALTGFCISIIRFYFILNFVICISLYYFFYFIYYYLLY